MESFERQTLWTVRVAAALAIVGFGAALLGCWLWGHGDINSPSALGDFIAGTSGPLWAVAGVLLVYLAFVGQRVQIVYQQAELRATRAEFSQQTNALRGQREEMEQQVMESRRQTFDNAFFQMLRLYNDILAETGVPGHGHGSAEMDRGRDAFTELVSRHRYWYRQTLEEGAVALLAEQGIVEPDLDSDITLFRERSEAYQDQLEEMKTQIHQARPEPERRFMAIDAYRLMYEAHQHEIGHYFRTLYHVVKFVDRADLAVVPDKQRYVSIVRSQLSGPELVMLAYNGLTLGRDRFKPLMEQYSLLKQMPQDDLVEAIRPEYTPEAFGATGGAVRETR